MEERHHLELGELHLVDVVEENLVPAAQKVVKLFPSLSMSLRLDRLLLYQYLLLSSSIWVFLLRKGPRAVGLGLRYLQTLLRPCHYYCDSCWRPKVLVVRVLQVVSIQELAVHQLQVLRNWAYLL